MPHCVAEECGYKSFAKSEPQFELEQDCHITFDRLSAWEYLDYSDLQVEDKRRCQKSCDNAQLSWIVGQIFLQNCCPIFKYKPIRHTAKGLIPRCISKARELHLYFNDKVKSIAKCDSVDEVTAVVPLTSTVPR